MHPPRNPRRRLSPARLTVTLALGIGAVLALQAPRPRALAAPAQAPHSGHSVASMSEAEMQRQVAEWYARHPLRGERSADVPSDSFLVNNFYFDENHDGSVTQVDTARIVRGQTILWRWQAGTHTVTNGTGAADPTAGLMFDQALNSTTPATFAFRFDTVGTFRFFCRFHELENMRGVVIVRNVVSAPAGEDRASAVGFVAPPWPNPSRGTVAFRFALTEAGRARAEVFDVSGRSVAVALERELPAGTYAAAWDGRDHNGGRAPGGIYLLRLSVPGRVQTRRVVFESRGRPRS